MSVGGQRYGQVAGSTCRNHARAWVVSGPRAAAIRVGHEIGGRLSYKLDACGVVLRQVVGDVPDDDPRQSTAAVRSVVDDGKRLQCRFLAVAQVDQGCRHSDDCANCREEGADDLCPIGAGLWWCWHGDAAWLSVRALSSLAHSPRGPLVAAQHGAIVAGLAA